MRTLDTIVPRAAGAVPSAGQLWLVPTPITEPGDATEVLPASTLQVVRSLGYFIAEEAKTARAFLKAAGIERPIQQIDIREFNEHTKPAAIQALLAPILAGVDAALISEAGCPAVADPGATLIAAARQSGIRIRPLVGPSAIMLALMASGLEGQRFRFEGYLPQQPQPRIQALRDLQAQSSQSQATILFIETPYRNQAMFDGAAEALAPDTKLLVATDIGGANEQIDCHPVADWRTIKPTLPKLPTVFGILAAPRAANRAGATPTRSAKGRQLK